jgi:Ice-binding-like
VTAYNYPFSDTESPPTQTVTGGLTSNQTFWGNNTYSFSSTDVTSTARIVLNFDAQGNSGDIFILKNIDNLTIDEPITFALTGGALASNIYWIIGSTATISPTGAPVTWDGSILAGTSFTMSANTGGSGVLAGTINGCVFAESGTATLAGATDVKGCTSVVRRK